MMKNLFQMSKSNQQFNLIKLKFLIKIIFNFFKLKSTCIQLTLSHKFILIHIKNLLLLLYSHSKPLRYAMNYSNLNRQDNIQKPQQKCLDENNFVWKIVHSAAFLTGGITFIIGSLLLFNPTQANSLLSCQLYVIGSIGFLTVDVLQFFTFTEDTIIRINICMSMLGSLLYIVGSAGFYPPLFAQTQLIGILGFILGSFFIGSSQLWKSYRIGSTADKTVDQHQGYIGFSLKNFTVTVDKLTQLGVQFSAGLGAWCFFFGTILFWTTPQEGPSYYRVLWIWVFGSLFFTTGGIFLFVRHFCLGF